MCEDTLSIDSSHEVFSNGIRQREVSLSVVISDLRGGANTISECGAPPGYVHGSAMPCTVCFFPAGYEARITTKLPIWVYASIVSDNSVRACQSISPTQFWTAARY